MTEETKLAEETVETSSEETEVIESTETTEATEENEAVEPAEDVQAVESAEPVEEQLDFANISSINPGDTVVGTIVKVEETQAFVSIGYKYDGIIPLRELTALHAENAEEVVEVGQQVECKVVSIDDNKEHLLLSKRAIDSVNAWEQIQAYYDSQETFEAKVAEVVRGGLVIDVGLRGFVPASMVERHYVDDFSDYKGRTIRLKVKELDQENNKVILSQKDVLDEEYELKKHEILNSLEAGQMLDGVVQRLTSFGAFVDIGGIDGLVHVSELAWTHVGHPSEVIKEGESVKVKVLKVDIPKEKISLSIKEAIPGPWDSVTEQFSTGDIVDGVVRRLVPFGAFVEIAPGIEGLVHISQISHQHIGTPHEVLEEGQDISVKVLDVNPSEKRVSLSIKETEDAPAPVARPDRQRNSNQEVLGDNQGLNLTLGERLGEQLSKLNLKND